MCTYLFNILNILDGFNDEQARLINLTITHPLPESSTDSMFLATALGFRFVRLFQPLCYIIKPFEIFRITPR